jgi:RimJ/RimL family protein N-acetyltransferase
MGDDVRLRDVEEPDLEVLFEQQLDPEAARVANFPSRDRERFMTHWRTRVLGDPTVLVQTVTLDGEVAGSIVAWWDRDRRFVGYWLGRPYWGRGVGTRALQLFLQRERVRPLYADPFSGNTASVRLLDKCGFERSGTVRYGQAEHIMLVLGA